MGQPFCPSIFGEQKMTISNKHIDFTSNFVSFLNNLKPGKVTTSVEAPENPHVYDVWKVVDPVLAARPGLAPADAVVCIRLRIPFQEYLKGIEGLAQEVLKEAPEKPVWATIQVMSRALEYYSKVPDFNPAFRPGFGHLNKMLDFLNHRNEPGYGQGYYGYGDAGCGKTNTLLWLASVLNMAVDSVNCSPTMVGDDLFVRQMSEDGRWLSVEGPLLHAVRHGWWFLMDELDLAPCALPPSLNDLVEGHAYSVPGLKKAMIQANNNFRLFSFGNTGFAGAETGMYNGRSIVDTSFKSRCIVDKYSSLEAGVIMQMIRARFSVEEYSDELVEATAAFAVSINGAIKEGGIADTFGPRSVLQFVEAVVRNRGLQHPLVYALTIALPLVIDDEGFRETAWNLMVTCFASLVPLASDIKEVWNDREARLNTDGLGGSDSSSSSDSDSAA